MTTTRPPDPYAALDAEETRLLRARVAADRAAEWDAHEADYEAQKKAAAGKG